VNTVMKGGVYPDYMNDC